MADPFEVNRQLQIGVESTSGTAVPANKLLPSITMALDPVFNATKYKGTGRRFNSLVVPDGQEAVTGALAGAVTFTELIYPASMAWGAAAITTPAGGVNAKQWVWNVPLTGRVNPKSMTIEQGDSDDSERAAYGILTDLGLDLSRAGTALSGALLAQAIEKYSALSGGSWTGMTASPTAIALSPVLPKRWDVYADNIYTALGTTKLTRCFKANFAYGGAFIPFYPMNSALSTYAGAADGIDVSAALSLSLGKDLAGEGFWTPGRAGSKRYLRVVALGDYVDNYFTTATGTGSGGNIKLSYKGQQATINFSGGWAAGAVQTAFLALTTVGVGNATVTGGPLPGTALVITMTGALAQDTTAPILDTTGVTGGSIANTLTPTQIQMKLQLDIAGIVLKPNNSDVTQGLRTRQWDFQIVEDTSWGSAILVTLVNNLSSL
jgi:hypothetical protein